MLGTPVLFLPIIEWEFRVQRPQQLARCFARAGRRVYYPRLRLGDPAPPQPVESGIWTFRLAGDPALDPYRDRLGPRDVELALRSLRGLAASHRLDGLWVIAQLPFWRPRAEAIRAELGGRLLFDCMDDFSAFADHGDCAAEELAMAGAADLVTTTSERLRGKLAPASARCVVVRNGCDPEHFGPAAVRPRPGAPPVVGFFGGIHEWFDAPLVAALAAARPGWEVWLIGDTYRADTAALRGLPNVHLLGEVAYADLPRAVSHFDVGIIPFRINRLTEATDPVKAYEMLAAGLPVVATPLPELARLAPHVALARTAEEFVARIEEALAAPREARAARREMAGRSSWLARFLELTELMAEVETAAGPAALPLRSAPPCPRSLGIGHDRSDLLRQVVRLEACLATAEDDRARLAAEHRSLVEQRDRVLDECGRLASELQRIERERLALEHQVQGLTSSRLWRAIRPLRVLRSRVSGRPLPS